MMAFMDTPPARPRPDAILDAALHIFDQSGFDAARVEDIAAAAGVAKGTVYLHFPSKVALLQALIERHVAPVAASAAAIAAAGRSEPLAALRRVVQVIQPMLGDARLVAVPRLVIAASNRFPEIAEHYRREVFDRVRGTVFGLVEEAMEQGRLQRADPAILVRALMGGVIFEIMRRHVLRDPAAEPAAPLEALLDLLEAKP